MTRSLVNVTSAFLLVSCAYACGGAEEDGTDDDQHGNHSAAGGGFATGTGGAATAGSSGSAGTLGSGGLRQDGQGGYWSPTRPAMGGSSGGRMFMPPSMGGAPGVSGGPGSSGSPGAGGAMVDPNDEFSALRQLCVDTINDYRATLGLPPLSRGTPEQETCSDEGAEDDATTGVAHGSAGSCRGLGAQNTCPGYPGDIESSMLRCLQQMWDEDEPAEGVQACIADRSGCFQRHGHWINMTSTSSTVVACGFYRMPNGRTWMNQNFGR